MLANRFVSRENAEAKGLGTVDMNRQTDLQQQDHTYGRSQERTTEDNGA
jgi:hypothetical protein